MSANVSCSISIFSSRKMHRPCGQLSHFKCTISIQLYYYYQALPIARLLLHPSPSETRYTRMNSTIMHPLSKIHGQYSTERFKSTTCIGYATYFVLHIDVSMLLGNTCTYFTSEFALLLHSPIHNLVHYYSPKYQHVSAFVASNDMND